MNLVFLNSLEKKVEEHRVVTAQVSICEEQGTWHVFWNEPNAQGKLQQDEWYMGTQWDEMLNMFRYRLAEKLSSGYSPIIDGNISPGASLQSKNKLTQMLYYYSEQHPNEALYEELRRWRREQAMKEGKAPYIIASNRILRLISCFIPQKAEELLLLPGLGSAKALAYGEAIVAITDQHEQLNSFPLDWVVDYINQQEFTQWTYKQYEIKLKLEMDKNAQKRKLLEGIERGESLNGLEELLSMSRRDLLLWLEDIDKEGYDVERLVEAELAQLSEEQRIKAWQAFELEGDRYLKPVVKHLYTEEELKTQDLNYIYEWVRLIRIQYRRDKGTQASHENQENENQENQAS